MAGFVDIQKSYDASAASGGVGLGTTVGGFNVAPVTVNFGSGSATSTPFPTMGIVKLAMVAGVLWWVLKHKK